MAENLKGAFERSMRRTFRVYLEPASKEAEITRQSTYSAEYSVMRGNRTRQASRKQNSYLEVTSL